MAFFFFHPFIPGDPDGSKKKVGLISVRSAVAYTSYATVPASLHTWMQHFGISVMSTEKCQGRTTNLTGVRLISTYLYKMTTQASQCGRPLDSRGRTSATIKDNKERTNNSDAVP
ncbi:hypothetical protein OUZ56_001929 [Daphnia magna]|uniref:Uncharacterized protein n=1 Tax=Daphnia magna TaxID=35525 RepID=A0ABR0A4J1_9CRUS|nr:hypothetical protein OUZ56_001929 [Daphnia magna]